MAKIASTGFKSHSGKKYSFNIYSLDTSFNNVGAVYIFSKRTIKDDTGTHSFIYIGETNDLSDRIPNHEKWPCVKKYGANCICTHTESHQETRRKIEDDLLDAHDPPCNKE